MTLKVKNNKKGKAFYLRYTKDGKERKSSTLADIESRLTNSDGSNCTTMAQAKKAYALQTNILNLKDKSQRKMMLNADYQDAETKVAKAIEDLNRLELSDVWAKFPYNVTQKNGETAISEKSVKVYKTIWSRFVDYMAGKVVYLDEVTPEQAKGFIDQLCQKYAGATVNKHIKTCRVIIRLAGIERCPFRGMQLKRENTKHYDAIPADAYQEIIDNATGEIRGMITMGCFTGLRFNDVRTMEWSSLSRDLTEMHRLTEKGQTWVSFPIHPVLREELAMTPESERTGYVFPGSATAIAGKASDKGHSRANLQVNKALGKYSFHCLRTSFATMCAKQDVPRENVRDWLGHKCAEVTKVYERWGKTRGASQILRALSTELGLESNPREALKALADSLPLERVAELVKMAQNG